MYLDLCNSLFELVQIIGRQFNIHCPDIFIQAMQHPLYRDLREGALNLLKVVRCKFDGNCADVLVQALKFPAARAGTDPL